MPADLVENCERGGFVLSTSQNIFHSVALDKSHEMLINNHYQTLHHSVHSIQS